jgi:hypothetical protein
MVDKASFSDLYRAIHEYADENYDTCYLPEHEHEVFDLMRSMGWTPEEYNSYEATEDDWKEASTWLNRYTSGGLLKKKYHHKDV